MSEQLSLLSEPRVRHDGSSTSRDAAAAVTPTASETEAGILRCFQVCGPMTDDEFCQVLEADVRGWPTLKSARSRLARRGALVPTGEKRPSVRGSAMQVWRLPC